MKKTLCIVLTTFMWWPLIAGSASSKKTRAVKSTVKPIVLTEKDLGSKANPVKCDKDKGEKEYLDRLNDRDGNQVTYERTGHHCTTTGTILDQYEIKSVDGKVYAVIYMNMYCPGNKEIRPIKGFQMNTQEDRQKTAAARAKASPGQKSTPPVINSMQPQQSTKPSPQEPGKEKENEDERIPGFDDVPVSPGKGISKPSNPQPTPPPSNPGKTGTPGTTGTSISQEDKIPGFDDVPGPSKGTSTASTTTPPASKISSPPAGKTYIALVPIPEKNKTAKVETPDTKIPGLIASALTSAVNGFIKKSNAPFMINQAGHTIHDKPKRFGAFFALIRSAGPDRKKLEKIEKQILTPWKIDLVFTALFSSDEKNQEYKVTPVIAGKADKKLFISKEFSYSYNMKPGELERDLKNKIIDIIQTEYPAVLQALPAAANPTANPTQTPVYISIIPPDLPAAAVSEKPKTLSELLNETIGKGINMVVNNNPKLSVNEAQHTVPGSGTAAKDLSDILDRPDLKDDQKVEKIIDEIMTPHGIDCIFTVQFKEMAPGNIVNFHLYAINKARKKIFPTNLIFQKEELVCEEAGTGKTMICQDADNNIANAVQALLEQAVK